MLISSRLLLLVSLILIVNLVSLASPTSKVSAQSTTKVDESYRLSFKVVDFQERSHVANVSVLFIAMVASNLLDYLD